MKPVSEFSHHVDSEGRKHTEQTVPHCCSLLVSPGIAGQFPTSELALLSLLLLLLLLPLLLVIGPVRAICAFLLLLLHFVPSWSHTHSLTAALLFDILGGSGRVLFALRFELAHTVAVLLAVPL